QAADAGGGEGCGAGVSYDACTPGQSAAPARAGAALWPGVVEAVCKMRTFAPHVSSSRRSKFAKHQPPLVDSLRGSARLHSALAPFAKALVGEALRESRVRPGADPGGVLLPHRPAAGHVAACDAGVCQLHLVAC